MTVITQYAHECPTCGEIALINGLVEYVPEVQALVEAAREVLEFHGWMADSWDHPQPVECDCNECVALRAALAPFEDNDANR